MDSRQLHILHNFHSSPTYYVEGYEESVDAFVVRKMSRQTYKSSSFLNNDLDTVDDLTDLLPHRETIEYFKTHPPPSHPLHFIFHFAFCGSTLLSRCLDYPGHTMVYKEPYFLHQVSSFARFPARDKFSIKDLLDFSLFCSQRTFQPSEVPIVKATDSCSNIVEHCLEGHPASKGIVLYNSLETFLLAMLKSERRRKYIRGMYERALGDLQMAGIHLQLNKSTLEDAEISGLVWFSLMHRYQKLLTTDACSLKSLEMQRFINHPADTLHQIAAYLQIALPWHLVEQNVRDAFRQNSKTPELPFEYDIYAKHQDSYRAKLATELSKGIKWVDQMRTMHPVGDQLHGDLFSIIK